MYLASSLEQAPRSQKPSYSPELGSRDGSRASTAQSKWPIITLGRRTVAQSVGVVQRGTAPRVTLITLSAAGHLPAGDK